MSYKIAAPDEYLAITGMGIDNIKITKAAWLFPFQRCMRFSIRPRDYAMDLQAMTKEKLQFLLPVVFTIGPDVSHRTDHGQKVVQPEGVAASVHGGEDGPLHPPSKEDTLTKYAMLLAENSATKVKPESTFLENIVKGIIEGETRVLVSSMTMEEIFTEREIFKRHIFRNIQGELSQLGLTILNANVKELKDAPNSVYFASLSRKAHEGAVNSARIDVAEAQLRGNVGEAKRKGEQERELAKIHADTAVQKVDRDLERAQAEATLATRKAGLDRDVDIARIEASRATESKDEALKRDVEIKRAAAELERLRATDVVKASIRRESEQQAADAKAYEIAANARANLEKGQREAEASAYRMKAGADAKAYETSTTAKADLEKAQRHAEAGAFQIQAEADAYAYAVAKKAEAHQKAKLLEADGLAAMAEAYQHMAVAFGGPAGLLRYMMLEKGTYVDLAKANADGIRGLQPKISVWNTGAQAGIEGGGAGAGGVGDGSASGAGGASIDTLRNVYQMLPPLMTTIHDQTGMTLPEWQFGRLAGEMSESKRSKTITVNKE
ncbi:flotillin domain containing protein [Grosmannia clavigera kw1407]|uniref:Flotillin domain containing protein n=1 Tax=Grosmannia clavigera (strain kw1407 / UAMH 11150) TaxID=655863 RepID=F0XQM9_GROCL|nr:flotillin domain containing protein [Grosmannia clavigera kw1407]EFW99701.1 flotillin domain containing protein [Grosmannia clavigera kw1407]